VYAPDLYFYKIPKKYQMDLSKLKGRPSYPFETIGVAVAFSPRLEAILGEAKRLADTFGAQLVLLHIGERTRTKEAKLDEVLRKLAINENRLRMIWQEGEPVSTLLELCKLHIIDILIIGAMKKENMLRYYLGSIARRISRKAKCSVLMLIEPNSKGTRFKKIVVNGVENPKTIHTLNTAIYFAKGIGASDITVATELHQPGLAMTMADDSTAVEASKIRKELTEDEMNKVRAIVTNSNQEGSISMTEKILKGKPGFAIREYAQQKHADLLVINSPDLNYGLIDRIFTHSMEFILEDLPGNVLVVHSRITA
jgi:nucleotide-binding universal stress UspA family protein